jgi:DNA repair exonuclease SbcCD ATPase subunit
MRGVRDEMEARRWALDEKREQLEDAFHDQQQIAIEELEAQTDQLREQRMLPLEELAHELDIEIENKWIVLSELYEQQGRLASQLKELEKTIRDLDRQAEFGVIDIISGALDKTEELEKAGAIDSFESFLPQIGGGGPERGGGE